MNDQEKTSELAKFSNFSFFYLPASCTLPQVKRNVYGCSTKCTHCFRITTHTSSVKKEKKEHTVNGDQLNSGLRLQNSYLWLIQISVMNEASINPLTKTEGRSHISEGTSSARLVHQRSAESIFRSAVSNWSIRRTNKH